MPELTPKQLRFCQEYLIDLNATQAAIRAGYSPKTAQEQSSRLLSKAIVSDYIKGLSQKREERTEINAEIILKELLSLATVDLSEAYDESGTLKRIHDIPRNVRKAIAQVEVFDEFEGVGKEREKIGETTKIKFYDKNKALEMLGKHLKLFTEKVEHSGSVTLGELIIESFKSE